MHSNASPSVLQIVDLQSKATRAIARALFCTGIGISGNQMQIQTGSQLTAFQVLRLLKRREIPVFYRYSIAPQLDIAPKPKPITEDVDPPKIIYTLSKETTKMLLIPN